MTYTTRGGFKCLKAGSTSAAAGPRVRPEGDSEEEDSSFPPFTGGRVERSFWGWKGTEGRDWDMQSEKQRVLRMLVFQIPAVPSFCIQQGLVAAGS